MGKVVEYVLAYRDRVYHVEFDYGDNAVRLVFGNYAVEYSWGSDVLRVFIETPNYTEVAVSSSDDYSIDWFLGELEGMLKTSVVIAEREV